MGWLWSTSPSDAEQKAGQKDAPPSSTPPAPHDAPSSSSQRAEPPSEPSQSGEKQLSRNEHAENDFKDFFRELDAPPAPINTLPAESPAARHARPSQIPTLAADPESIHPVNLYPREMSCRAAFDQAFYCQSLGGQWINVYRYGEMRDCSESWSNFWFCMRTNQSYGRETRQDKIREHYWKREEKYRKGPSSEDVWMMRTKMVRDAFNGDFDTMEKEQKAQQTELATGAAVDIVELDGKLAGGAQRSGHSWEKRAN